jgi:hypothetical protein
MELLAMLTVLGHDHSRRFCDGLSRRSFLSIGGLALGGLSLPRILEAESSESGKAAAPQKAVIMIYLPGGPTQHETIDPKPDAQKEVRGPFGTVQTTIPGVRFSHHLTKLARAMDKIVAVRSVVGFENRHESFQCHTGRSGGRPQDDEPAGGWPTFGSVVSRLQGTGHGGTPAYVDAGPKMGYGPYNNTGLHDASAVRSWPGFLGFPHTPFSLDGDGKGDLVLNGIGGDRFADRRALVSAFDRFRRDVDRGVLGDASSISSIDSFRRQALDILTSSRIAEALDLEREDPRVRERYGKSVPTTGSFGGAPKDPQRLLLARRLVEAGARCVTVSFGAWDWHGNRGGPVEKLGNEDLPMFDHAVATLIDDLDQRGLLDDVSVVVWGEFGRTPKINAKGGRDHWSRVAPVILAGGGMRCGQVIGATDAQGGTASERPVHVQEIFATLYHNLGIDVASATVRDLNGRPHYLVDHGREPIRELV